MDMDGHLKLLDVDGECARPNNPVAEPLYKPCFEQRIARRSGHARGVVAAPDFIEDPDLSRSFAGVLAVGAHGFTLSP
jgi:hypothetical protein